MSLIKTFRKVVYIPRHLFKYNLQPLCDSVVINIFQFRTLQGLFIKKATGKIWNKTSPVSSIINYISTPFWHNLNEISTCSLNNAFIFRISIALGWTLIFTSMFQKDFPPIFNQNFPCFQNLQQYKVSIISNIALSSVDDVVSISTLIGRTHF